MSAKIAKSRLTTALRILSKEKLLSQVLSICEKIPEVQEILIDQLLAEGKDVHRYHADTDSEAEGDDINREEYKRRPGDESTKNAAVKGLEQLQPIGVADDELTPRFVRCENCKEEFDVTENERRTCTWHTGRKSANYDDDFWCDHDENCHGIIEDFQDDPDMAEGFIWECCSKQGDGEGCKFTKHKARVNLVLKNTGVTDEKRLRENEETGLRPSKKVKV